MLISIVTINYNHYEGLKKTMNSVFEQTYSNWEYIIIDGGSNDGSKEQIERHKDHLSYWVSEPDKGIYNALNKGVDRCKGEYILFLNSGDLFYEPTTLEKFVHLGRKEDFVYGNVLITGRNPDPQLKVMPDALSIDNCLKFTITHQAIFHKAQLFQKHRYDESYSIIADWVFFNNALLLDGANFYHMDETVAIYDGTGFSSNKTYFAQREKERDRYFEWLVPIYLKQRTGRRFKVKVTSEKESFIKRLKDKL